MQQPQIEPPVNPLPPVVWLLVMPIVAVEVVVALGAAGLAGGAGGIGFRQEALMRFVYMPEMGRAMVEAGQYPLSYLGRLLSYSFVHASFTHALMVAVFLLALGKIVGERFSGAAVAVVFLGSGAMGALVYTALPFTQNPLIGGYPAVYGLVGAFTWILWTRLGQEQAPRAGAFSLIGMLLGVQLVFGLIFGAGQDWVAEIAGFATGFGLSFLVAPGGWRHALERLRRR